MKNILLFFTLCFLSLNGFSQNGSITGVLLDSIYNEGTINFATISVYKGLDTTMYTYKLSNDKGVFKIQNLELDEDYVLIIDAWLYNQWRSEIHLTAEIPDLDLGEIYLDEQYSSLNEVVISAYRPPIIVKKDTIEFNAESFKTLPNAVVEDLLKKLPGVNVATDGSITVNGRLVSKILVDSREFFGGDQQIATKNLPADIIDKIQVTDDVQIKRRNPDLLAGEIPQVINLKLKKSIKKGAFGKVFAGGGLDGLYEAGGILNFFRDTTQVSILGYANNTNKPGFAMSDVMRIGGMQRRGVSRVMVSNTGNYELDGISFGGSLRGGVQTSSGAGANMNTMTKNGTKINFSYFLGHGDNLLIKDEKTEQSLGDEILFSNSTLDQSSRNTKHQFGTKIEKVINDKTTINFNPNLGISNSKNNGLLITETRDVLDALNTNSNATNLKNQGWDLRLPLDIWHDFAGDKGGSLNSSVEYYRSKNDANQYNYSRTTFFMFQKDSLLNQRRDNLIFGSGLNVNINYSQPLNKKFTMRLRTQESFLNNQDALSSFIQNPLHSDDYILIPNLTETVRQKGLKTTHKASLRWKINKSLYIEPGVVYNTINLENSFIEYPNFDQKYQFFGSQLNIRYKSLNLSYEPVFREPSLAYIQPVANNTNPLLIQNGNPNLLPTRSHNIYLNFYQYNVEKSLNYYAYLGGNIDNDGIVMSRIVQSDGIQINTPINANGIWNLYFSGHTAKDFKSTETQFGVEVGFWGHYKNRVVLINGIQSTGTNLTFAPEVGGSVNLKDVFEFKESFSVEFNNSRYEDSFFTNQSFKNYVNKVEVILRISKKVVLETSHDWTHYTQNLLDLSNDIQIWHAAATLLTMENDRFQIKLSANDILNANTYRQLFIQENYLQDTKSNTLGRHYLLTLTYNIQNFGQKVGGRETMFMF